MTVCLVDTCDRIPDHGNYACDECVEHLRHLLREVDMYLRIVTPMRPTLASGPSSAGYESRSPAADHVLVLLDPRSKANGHQADNGTGRIDRPDDEPDPLLSVPGVLGDLAYRMWDEVDHDEELWLPRWRPRDVGDAITLLLAGAPWLAGTDWLGQALDEVRAVRNELRSAANDSPPDVIATCTEVEHGRVCGGPVRELPATEKRAGGARCGDCTRVYSGLDLVRLQIAQEAAS